ncbi:MAG: geranylgeranyl reductase family protein [Bifidobacteriaceae bacterium]|jgi:geranylgeranyl reductase family protein|nr:geranylgeranyl reductase family protein [Bifidobacteriaceae bacterium]
MTRQPHGDADVIVVGAGPAGSTAAAHLARGGARVIVLEKATFPRDKVCGDGLTPLAVKELGALGLTPGADWCRQRGLRVRGGGHELELPWPVVAGFPTYSLTRPRAEFDTALARHAQVLGARVAEGVTATDVVRGPDGAVSGVETRPSPGAQANGLPTTLHAPIVLAADGAAARLARKAGRHQLEHRPMGVAASAYFRTERETDMMESYLELWDGPVGKSNLMPGYGWIFPVAPGLVNVGLGTVSSHPAGAQRASAGASLEKWAAALPDWRLTPDRRVGRIRSGALPMAINRAPLAAGGLLLLGDAAGLVSPFNGEGIGHAMVSGRIAAAAALSALGRTTAQGRELALNAYGRAIGQEIGGYFALGRIFVRLIERPQVMNLCTRYGLPRPVLMRFVMKLLSGVYARRGGDWMDRVIRTATRAVPAVRT